MRTMRSLMRRTLLVVLVSSLAGAMLVSGCAESAPTPVVDDLAQVADASRNAETASFSLRVEQKLGDEALAIDAEGAFDTARNRARLSVDLSSLATIFAELGKAFGAPKGGLQGFDDPAKWKLEAIQDGTRIFLSSPLLESALPKGKTWISGDLAKLGREQGVDLGQLGSFGQSDPREALDMLRGVSGDLEEVGRETVRGVETTRYRATLDARKLAAQLAKGGDRDLVGGLVDEVEQAGLRDIPLEVWVDDELLLRRLDLRLNPSNGSGGDARFTMELFDYGEPVDATPPPASLVADVSQLRSTD
jgi:hypothetical protein